MRSRMYKGPHQEQSLGLARNKSKTFLKAKRNPLIQLQLIRRRADPPSEFAVELQWAWVFVVLVMASV